MKTVLVDISNEDYELLKLTAKQTSVSKRKILSAVMTVGFAIAKISTRVTSQAKAEPSLAPAPAPTAAWPYVSKEPQQ